MYFQVVNTLPTHEQQLQQNREFAKCMGEALRPNKPTVVSAVIKRYPKDIDSLDVWYVIIHVETVCCS